MNRQEIAQQIQYRIYNLLKDRLRSNPKKQFKTAISVRYLALLKKRFGVNGRFKSNRPLECYFDFPESRVIRGNLITYPQNRDVYLKSICIWKVFSNTFFFMYLYFYLTNFLIKYFYLYLYLHIEKTVILNTNTLYFKN